MRVFLILLVCALVVGVAAVTWRLAERHFSSAQLNESFDRQRLLSSFELACRQRAAAETYLAQLCRGLGPECFEQVRSDSASLCECASDRLSLQFDTADLAVIARIESAEAQFLGRSRVVNGDVQDTELQRLTQELQFDYQGLGMAAVEAKALCR